MPIPEGSKINCRVGIVCHKTRSCSTCAFPIPGLIHFQLSKWYCISLCSHLSHASYQWAGNMTIGCASTSLMLRTWVLLLQLYLNHQSNGDWWINLQLHKYCSLESQKRSCDCPWRALSSTLDPSLQDNGHRRRGMELGSPCMCCRTDEPKTTQHCFLLQ